MKKILFFACFLSVYSCAKKQDCQPGGVNILFEGYDTSSLDTVTIERYVINTNHSVLVLSENYILQDTVNYFTHFIGENIVLDYRFSDDYEDDGILRAVNDYKIITKNNTYYVKNMEYLPESQRCGGLLSLDCFECLSKVIRLEINGYKTIPTDKNRITLQK